MSQDQLGQRILETCLIRGEFVLRSGRVADQYFDKYQFEADPALLHSVAVAMAELVPPDTEVLAGLEMGAIAIVAGLAQQVSLPCAFVRKEAKPYGTRRLSEGASVAGRRVLVVEDVVTSGGQVIKSTNDLRELGADIHRALCVIDRKEGGSEALAASGIALDSLFRFEDGQLLR